MWTFLICQVASVTVPCPNAAAMDLPIGGHGRKLAAGACPSQSSGCLDCSYLLSSYDLPTFHHLNVMLTLPCIQDATHRDPEVDRGRPLNLACQASSMGEQEKAKSPLHKQHLKRCKYQIMRGLHGPWSIAHQPSRLPRHAASWPVNLESTGNHHGRHHGGGTFDRTGPPAKLHVDGWGLMTLNLSMVLQNQKLNSNLTPPITQPHILTSCTLLVSSNTASWTRSLLWIASR